MIDLNPFLYGCCYYPEAWDASRHGDDIARMADAGFNFVRMGESAWAYWEPREGEYQFDLFDRVIDLCKQHGIKVMLGTPTYAAPAWVSHTYPEVLRRNANRIAMAHGSRRNFNYTSHTYLKLSDNICTALAEHYKNESQIIGWQLDNEFNCHMDVSYAVSDTLAFQAWLADRYKTLDRLNEAWGTKFWSQTYDSWEQIDLPHPTAATPNPHQVLDETRFISDCVVNFAARQAAILRKASKHWFITHNGLFSNIDPLKLASVLDIWSHDQYPLFWADGQWHSYAQKLIEARAISEPFLILEQQAGPGGQSSYLHRTPRPGEMRQWAWQSISHGAGLFSYFRWRTCPYGAEQHWHGLIEPDNRDTRRLAEAKVVGEEIRKLPRDFYNARLTKTVGVLRDFDNDANDVRINTYTAKARWEHQRYLSALQLLRVPMDLLWPASSFVGHRLIIAPHLAIINAALVEKLTLFVKSGGTLVLGAQSGTMNRDLHLIDAVPPGLLKPLAGVEVDDWSTMVEPRDAVFADGSVVALSGVVERLRLCGATSLAHWDNTDTLLDDAPAIAVNRVGSGRVIYVGGYVDEASAILLAKRWMADLKIVPLATAEACVEIIQRSGSGKRYLSLLNYGTTSQIVTDLPDGVDLLTGHAVEGGRLTLASFGVAIIESASVTI